MIIKYGIPLYTTFLIDRKKLIKFPKILKLIHYKHYNCLKIRTLKTGSFFKKLPNNHENKYKMLNQKFNNLD